MTEKIKILGSKAEIFRNKFGVWQFRFYVKEAKKNIYKSLHTKEKTIALERGEDLYIEIRNDIKKGKSFVGMSIKDFPGETLALMDSLDLSTVELQRVPFCSRISYFVR